MRRFAVLLLLAAAAALLPASKADAYKLFKHRWYSKTLTYYDGSGGRYKDEIRAAASVLNRSGARIRVRSASRRSARVRISVSGNLRPAGQARYFVRGGIVRNARIILRPDLANNWPTPVAARMGTIAVVAHEMAHVLGLDHENRRCATMNSVLWSRCNLPRLAWLYRCRIFERDDVRGLVRRFGGRVKSVGQELCEAEPGPAAPLGLTLTPDPPSGAVTIAWTEGAVPLTRTEVLRKAGGCPTGGEDTTATLVARIESGPGQAKSVQDLPPGVGSYCYAVVALGPLGRPGVVGTATINYVGLGPTARFDASFETNRRVRFVDQSSDRDGQVVAWSWTFRPGQVSASQNPTYEFPGPGSYPVTLTVTDNTGQVNSLTRNVIVSA